MWAIRVLAHHHPEVLRIIEEYLKTDEHPLAAKLFAIFALSHPQSPQIVKLLDGVLRQQANLTLAIAVCMTFDATAIEGIGRSWHAQFRYMVLLGLDAKYDPGKALHEFMPVELGDTASLYHPKPSIQLFTPLVTSTIGLLERSDLREFKTRIMKLARSFLRRIGSQEDGEAFYGVIKRSYLNADQGWREALDVLVRPNGGHVDFSLLAAGLMTLEEEKQVTVLSEVASISREGIQLAPFQACLANSVEYLARDVKSGGPNDGQLSSLYWTLVTNPPSEEWTAQYIAAYPSQTLRRRIASVMQAYAGGGTLDSTDAKRVCEAAMALLEDEGGQVRLLAASALIQVLEHSRQSLPTHFADSVRKDLEQWLIGQNNQRYPNEEHKRLLREMRSRLIGK